MMGYVTLGRTALLLLLLPATLGLVLNTSMAVAQNSNELDSNGLESNGLEPIVAKSNSPVAVTVFEDRARVRRSAEATVGEGTHRLLFRQLPGELNTDSLHGKVSGSSSGDILILGVHLDPDFPDQGTEFPESTLKARLIQIDDELLALWYESQKNNLFVKMLVRYSEILRSVVSDSTTVEDRSRWRIKDIEPIQQWLLNGEVRAAAEADRLARLRSNLRRQRQDILNDLENFRRDSERLVWNATVTFLASEATTATIELAYDIPSARWEPIHEARLDEDTGWVTWNQRARVIQSSGEHWTGVEMTLSTLRSSLGLSAGELIPVEVSLADREEPTDGAVTTADLLEREALVGRPLREEPETDAGDWSSPVIETGFGGVVSFRIKNRVDIPADGSPHTVNIQTWKGESKLDYEAIPSLGQGIYRRAKLISPGPGMLLSGEVQCFRSGTYVGLGEIGNIAPGQEFKQYFGLDGRLKLFVQELAEVQTPSRSAFSSPKYEKKALYAVTSFLDKPALVEIVGRIPVSMVEELVIEVGKETDPEAEVSRDGICRWELALDPGERKEVIFHWIAEADRGSESLLDLVDDD